MLTSIIIILLITFGGTLLTYLYEKEDSLLVRVGAGNVIGSTIFGTIAFVLACFFGFSPMTILIALVVTLLPAILLKNKDIYQNFIGNLRKARGKFAGATAAKFLNFLYYFSILIILALFFDRAMIETKDGIFTGGSNNLGDLPFHLGAIFSFTEGNNFPPENPSFAGAKFTYPFLVDFIVACLMKFGVKVADAMFWQNLTLGFSLVVLLEKFAFALTKNRLAGKLAPVILLLSGGLGFVLFFRDYWQDGRSFFEFIWNLEKDYTIKNELLRWGNSLIVLFITQRGFLLGMPIVLIVLTHLWGIFNASGSDHETDRRGNAEIKIAPSLHRPIAPSFFIGLLAGTLPLIHVHSLFTLFVVSAFLFFFDLKKVKIWLIFGLGVCVIAVPELIWSLTGSASNLSKFIGWHWGWDKGEYNFLLFWGANLGLFIPLLIIALLLKSRVESRESEVAASPRRPLAPSLLFYTPFAFIFILSNTFKLAPWEWDNIKVLIYWFVASVPFVAWVLAWLWEREIFYKFVAIACLIILTLSGGLDVWRVVSRQINYQVFSRDAVKIAEEIKQKTVPNALFLNAPTYNSAVVLAGRRSLMRYVGHLSSYGIDYIGREEEVKRIYEGSATASSFLQKNNIEYVLISPEEESYLMQNNLLLDEDFFAKYPKIAEVGEYKVYKIR
jgi:hypothetical protein